MNDVANDLTAADIEGFYTATRRYNAANAPAIRAKLAAAYPPSTRNHRIDCTQYDRVFVTSDIHSDLRKFVQMLTLNGLMGTAIDPYAGDAIYDPALITDSVWTGGERTLIVIVGDIVDGKRTSGRDIGPDDTRGSFELLLFALLYNLRRKANRENSEIRFTMGNHEMSTIILPDLPYHTSMYDKYVTNEAKAFFSSNQNRIRAILPFLNTCPYYMLGFYRGDTNEMACVHGGFHRGPDDDVTGDLETAQTAINGGAPLNSLPEDLSNPAGPLWNRTYNQVDGFCEHIASPYPFIIVGHCPTMLANGSTESRTSYLTKTKGTYAGCDSEIIGTAGDIPNRVGCVVLDCQGDHDLAAPKLAFVDVGMSRGQRWPSIPSHGIVEIPNRNRPAQMLLLTHDPLLVEDRYFNRIDRVASVGHTGFAVSGADDTNTLLYQAAPKPVPPQGVQGFVGSPGVNNGNGPSPSLALTGGIRYGKSKRSTRKQKRRNTRRGGRRR